VLINEDSDFIRYLSFSIICAIFNYNRLASSPAHLRLALSILCYCSGNNESLALVVRAVWITAASLFPAILGLISMFNMHVTKARAPGIPPSMVDMSVLMACIIVA